MSLHRGEVLSLYRKIFRLARTWVPSSSPALNKEEEKQYMCTEARRLFKKNKDETDEEVIKQCIKEAETRIGLAEHYGTPYPRMMNIPQNTLAPRGVSKFKKAQRRAIEQGTPIYLKSFKEENLPER